MDEQWLEKLKVALKPFETAEIISFIKTLSVKSAMERPLFMVLILLFFVFGLVKRSKFVLLTLFTTVAVMLLVRFFMPVEGDQLDLKSTVPFVFGGVAIGAALVYFLFIKAE
jgi:hypothetical protein